MGVCCVVYVALLVAGHLPQPTGGDLIVGKIGKDLTPEDGYDAAHHVALSLMATLKRTSM
jgi:hypothetical protein